MMTLQYRPGEWIGARVGSTMVFLAPESDASITAEVWSMLHAHARAADFAQAIMDRPDPLLSAMPDFVIVALGEAMDGDVGPVAAQILVRGSTDIRVDGGLGNQVVSDLRGGRWQEAWIDDAISVRIQFPKATPIADSLSGPAPWLSSGANVWLPLMVGMAPMDEVAIDTRATIPEPIQAIARTTSPVPHRNDVDVPLVMELSSGPSLVHGVASTMEHPFGLIDGSAPGGGPDGGAPVVMVPTLLCVQGHPNPPHGSHCRLCGGSLDSAVVPMPRPPLGIIRFTSGAIVELANSVVIGRSPRPVRAGPLPILIPVPGAGHDISRNHLEVQLEGWHVLATDLDSVNGTMLFRTGEDPVTIVPMVPAVLVDGDVLDLGGGVAIRYEVGNPQRA